MLQWKIDSVAGCMFCTTTMRNAVNKIIEIIILGCMVFLGLHFIYSYIESALLSYCIIDKISK